MHADIFFLALRRIKHTHMPYKYRNLDNFQSEVRTLAMNN